MAVGRALGHGNGRASTAFVVSLSAALVAAGCAGTVVDDFPPLYDAGPTRDAFVAEAGPIRLDGDVRDGPAASDAARAPDAAAVVCPMSTCDPRTGDGCPLETTCRPIAAGAECAMLMGSGAAGSPCMSSVDCGPGLACFRHGSVAMCGRVCCVGGTDCDGTDRCVGGRALWDGTTTPWGECVAPRACNVLHPGDTCDMGDGCYIVSPDGATDCRPAGSAAEGAECVEPSDCAPGLFCGGLSRRTCARICAIPQGGGASCPAGTVCRAYTYSPAGTGICS